MILDAPVFIYLPKFTKGTIHFMKISFITKSCLQLLLKYANIQGLEMKGLFALLT